MANTWLKGHFGLASFDGIFSSFDSLPFSFDDNLTADFDDETLPTDPSYGDVSIPSDASYTNTTQPSNPTFTDTSIPTDASFSDQTQPSDPTYEDIING